MADFYSRIRNIEAQLNRLKSVGLTSTSSLGVAYQDITVPIQIIATRYLDGQVYECGASKIIDIYIEPAGGEAAIVSDELISPVNFGHRPISKKRWISDQAGYKYRLELYVIGSHDDLAALNRGETIPLMYFVFRIKSTSAFTYKVEYRDVEIDYE